MPRPQHDPEKHQRHHPARARLALGPAAVLAALVLLTAGCSSGSGSDGATGPGAGAAHSASTGASHTDDPGGTKPSAPPAADPARVTIPSLGVDSSLMALGLNKDGTVEVPPADRGMTAGWYTGGAVPGEPGAAVIIGHNSTRLGRAVFHDLKKIREGADIAVRNTRGATLHFTVTGTETVGKTSFPTQKVYGPTDARALRLITCDGAFDAQGHPVDNLIVYATLS
ncbi:class F sortase [Streptomyces sp. SID3212]|uniref:class F sortase n=1 Tax=Streptomyces sp. SID3212 TaxID=2690259 RepID=UPI001370A93C|nr:class F sortase [Streptomyces sp. SID3212]MYV56710.1 class F sortase [Streptomyces sp. SID3212]